MSSRPAIETCAITLLSCGFRVASVSPERAGTKRPSMKSCVCMSCSCRELKTKPSPRRLFQGAVVKRKNVGDLKRDRIRRQLAAFVALGQIGRRVLPDEQHRALL